MRLRAGRGHGWRKYSSPVVLTLTAAATLLGCAGADCDQPPFGVVALSIQIIDAESGAAICDAQVSIRHGSVTERLVSNCTYSGGSAAAVYEITVTHEGYQDKLVSDIKVGSDECSNPVTETVTVELLPV